MKTAATFNIIYLCAAFLTLFQTTAQQICNENQFDCGNGQCIDKQLRCDGYGDCSNGRDENNCTERGRCRIDQFTCKNGDCISLSRKCDREYDCADYSDEINCPCRKNDFRCQNGFCISEHERCDGIHQCQDGSDELGCSTKCEPNQWKCYDGTCIEANKRCNKLFDCADRSDEIGCDHCTMDQFRCDDGTCLKLSVRCNGVPDCINGEDEDHCGSCHKEEFPCKNGQCIDERYRCNTIRDCTDGSDEEDCDGCGPDQFRCNIGICITGYKRCNGYSNCPDGSDEQNCPRPTYLPPACPGGLLRCHDGKCVSGKKCDRIYDCSDGSDELNCTGSCDISEFQCTSGHCIDERLRCDGLEDCKDGSDELDCVDECPADQFRCGDGLCLDSRRQCDGYSDCLDGSDERNCPGTSETTTLTPTCRGDQFQCFNGRCVDSYLVCDGVQDCDDGSDERDCPETCATDEFQCRSDKSCIPETFKCNGNSECDDNSDEEECQQVSRCSSNQLRCDEGRTCYEVYQQCDGNYDCRDRSDERECPCRSDQFQCSEDNNCIDINLRCNQRNDCSRGSDEYNCPTLPPPDVTTETVPPVSCPYDFTPCRSQNQCVRREQLCDGRVDCNDLSDETNCPASSDGLNLRTYPDSQTQKEHIFKTEQEVVFTCRDESMLRANVHWERANGLPLPPGTRDIGGRLEIPNIQLDQGGTYHCVASGYPPNTPGAQVSVTLRVLKRERPPPRPPVCNLYEATCANGDCIPKNKVCDGAYDCADGSDESRCNPNGCEPNEFQCSNKKCILKTWRCDSDDDCGDGSDEANCATNPPGSLCAYHQFACHSNNQCIPKSYHCDMERDCVDGSDEVGCSKAVISRPPPPMVNLNIGEIFEITCTAVGIPTPEIVWRKNWGHIPSKCKTTSENGFGRLICENIQIEDQGAYSCEAINIKGATFAVPDTILVIKQDRVCPAGYFNNEARTESECIKCFCFGHTSECRSADLFIFQFQPPFDSLKLLGVHIEPNTGVIDIRDEPIFRGAQPNLSPVGPKGVYASIPEFSSLSQPDVVPYFAMPENYHGNQLKSYGGYLRYTVRHSNRGYPVPGPSVIISGNGYTLLHLSTYSPAPNTNEQMEVRFFEGDWIRKAAGAPEVTATREEIMMVLEDIDNILLKVQYNEGILNTTITNIEMDSAATPDSGLGAALYVEQCSCPVGYTGSSCERCDNGYTRQESGPWLGKCYKEVACRPGQYFDGRECQDCPCPHTTAPNQFATTCQLGPDGDVVCNCPPQYVGRRCEQCAPGYEGNPLVRGDYCKPSPVIRPTCSPDGSLDPRPDPNGRCRCKQLVEGPSCTQCKTNTFYLNSKNQFGCIPCFCMGVSQQCSSSNWYRDQVSNIFTSSISDFKIVDNFNRETPITQGIRLNQDSQEISYSSFSSPNAYYWSLPSRYLGNKVTSYGGSLRYSLRHSPVPGGQSSRNSAADVELVSKNNINLLHFNPNQTQPTNAPQTFSVPLLEQYWQRSDGQAADREHLLMVLADLEAIYIKATYFTNTRESSLISVSLDTADERNTGSLERALEVEQCKCPVGYIGLSCEDCDIGYYRTQNGIYLGLCEPCECNGHSNECDPDTGICVNCRDFTTGENCEECLPGYTGNPRNGQPCVVAGITPPPCECDPRGSTSPDCTNNRCSCKVNVEGSSCNRCRTGTFGLNVSNIDGCETCFCSGVASECGESNLYIEQIPIQIIPNTHGFTLTDQDQRTRISEGFEVDMFMNQISYNLPEQRETLYWSLPSVFTGNKIKSYGGKLEFTQRYTASGRYIPDRDVIIVGKGIRLYWTNTAELRPDTPNLVSAQLHPSAGWMRMDDNRGPSPASREDFLMVLANIDSILVRATVASNIITTHLSDITLDTAVDTYTGQARASNVEVCRCPPGYRGSSCESCSLGFYRDLYYDSSKPLGSCSRCPCNNREASCEMGSDRRVICHCQPNYSGPYCENDAGMDYTTTPRPDPSPTPKPNIDVTIEDHSIGIYEVGSTVRYNCSARSQLAPRTVRVKWTKATGQLPSRAIDDGRGLLVITDVRVTDSGRYICEASDGYSIVTQSVDLTVGVREDERPRVAVSQPYIEVTEHQPVEVTCATTGIPTPDLTILRLDGQRLNPLTDGVFRISRTQMSDSGDYECIASNRAGTDSVRFKIVVRPAKEDILKVNIEPAYYTGTTGERVVLRCITTADTQGIVWSKEGGRLPYDSREDRGMLIITNSRPQDSGVYVCSVTSLTGSIGSSRVTVTIIDGQSQQRYPEVKVSPERITISQGQSTELQCTATGYPAPTVKWTKLGEELRRNIEQIGSTLFIRNAQVEDRGMYVCVATNQNGIEQASVVVEVTRLEMPQLEIYPQLSQTVVAGQSAVVQCRAIAGIPTPTIVWRRENGLPLGPKVEEMSGGTLRFIDISRNEEGRYICTGTNEAGTTTATANIIVHTQPEIHITPERDIITRNVGDSLVLECRGSGIPEPNVYFSKYTTYESRIPSLSAPVQNIATQQFNRLTTDDAGLYICRAESSAGIAEKRVQLVVDSLPSRGDITERYPSGEDSTGGRIPDWRDNEPPPTEIPRYDKVYTAGVGARAEIKCRMGIQDQTIQVRWTRPNNQSLPQEAYERSGTLYIDNVQPYAEGEYRCLGINQQTGQVIFRLDTYLKVLSPPRITLIPPKQVVHPGQNAFINCTTTGEQPITIDWLPIGRNMPSSVYTRDGYIRFNNIQLQDAGRYLCRARNNAGEAEATADVIVEENFSQPAIQAEQKRQIAPVGTLVTLRCKAGNPDASNTIRWFRENSASHVYGDTWRIPNVQRSDQGRYYCEISAKEGTFRDYIDLELTGPTDRQPEREPEPLYISPPETEHRAGESIDINCQSSERGVITSWSKPSSRLPNNAQNIGGTLRLINLRPDNSGIYRCEATGRRGVYYKDYNLQVMAEEFKDQPPIQIKVAPRGSSMRLECNTNLREPITYTWSKQGGSLPTSTDIYSKNIVLNDLGSMDAATYTCTASSGATSIDVPIIVVVTGIVPYFTQAPNSYITLPTLGDSYMQFSFEISFKPENENGLILYNGNKGNDKTGDFMSLALVNSVPEFKFNLGHSTTTVKSDRPITNRQWHTVKVVRNKKKVTMFVDGNGPYIGFADGKYMGLDLTEPLYLGGVPTGNNISPDVFPYSPYVGFVGCISRFKIGHSHLDILSEALNKTGTTTCETCSENKCENQGACQEALSKEGYTCICPSGFSGPTCNKLKGEACSPYACGVGRCIDTENSFECQCPLGRAGRRCEREITINEPAFHNDAFIAYPTMKPARRLKFTMKVKPTGVEDGILLYSSETEEGHGDFISLAIREKHLEFRFDAGNGVTVIRDDEELVPGQWHIITATRSLSDGRLTVDAKTSTGRLAGNHKTLNLHTPLYIGGFDKHTIKVNDGVKVASGFDGCISDINVSGLDINMIMNATDASNIADCNSENNEGDIDNNISRGDQAIRSYDSSQTGCSSNPCQNNGQCYPLTPTEYRCSCPSGFTGKSCEISQDICEQRPCLNQGICRGNNTHFVCDCLLGHTGVNCEQRIELHNDAHFDGNGFLEFNRDLLDHADQNRQEVIAFELSTNSSDGLIFWHGQTPEKEGIGQDFIALAVENGYLEFSFDLGNGPAIIRNLHKRIDDGEQHTVVLKREGRTGSIEIDNTWIEKGEAEGFTTEMNTNGNIYIGGTPNISGMTGGRFSRGFTGCIHGFEVQNSDRLDLGIKAINGLNIKPCSSSLDSYNSILY